MPRQARAPGRADAAYAGIRGDVPTSGYSFLNRRMGYIVAPWNTSATKYWLVGDPADCQGLEVGFVNVRDSPQLFLADDPRTGLFLTNDHITRKVRFEFGAAIVNCRPFAGYMTQGRPSGEQGAPGTLGLLSVSLRVASATHRHGFWQRLRGAARFSYPVSHSSATRNTLPLSCAFRVPISLFSRCPKMRCLHAGQIRRPKRPAHQRAKSRPLLQKHLAKRLHVC